MPRLRAPRLCLLIGALALVALVAACGSDDDDDDDGGGEVAAAGTVDFSARAVGEAFNPGVQPVLVNSALGVGPNRVTFGLFRDDRSLIMDATATLRLYRVDGDRGTFVSEHALLPASIAQQTEHEHGDGSTHIHDDPFATIYYANVEFGAAGRWGAVLTVSTGDQTHKGLLTQQFVVLETTPEPHIGQPLPASSNLTLRDVDDISEIGSSEQPIEELHELTVAEALATGKPVLVAISTPAFCQRRFCGPMLEGVVVPLWEEFGGVVQFVHVEPFDLNEARNNARLVSVPLMAEWSLQSEPWIFVADRDGLVVAKFEGIAAVEEVRDVLMDVVSADPSK